MIPTAEKFLELKKYPLFNDYGGLGVDYCKKAMIEFAKLHVEAALKRAYNNQGMSWTNSTNEESKIELFMKNSYPLSNIK